MITKSGLNCDCASLDKLNIFAYISICKYIFLILNKRYFSRLLHIFHICKDNYACNHTKYYLCSFDFLGELHDSP